MKTGECCSSGQCGVWDYAPAPDVWWGDDGIDASLWVDPTPYTEPESLPVERATLATAGESR